MESEVETGGAAIAESSSALSSLALNTSEAAAPPPAVDVSTTAVDRSAHGSCATNSSPDGPAYFADGELPSDDRPAAPGAVGGVGVPQDGTPQPPDLRVALAAEEKALRMLRECSSLLYSELQIQPVARATAAWGRGKLGVVLSALGSVLQRAPAAASWRVSTTLYEKRAVLALFDLLAGSRREGDGNGCEGTLWCIASIAHVAGGRSLQLDQEPFPHRQHLFDALLPAAPGNERIFALHALCCVSADPLSVRVVSKKIKLIQEMLRSEDEEAVILACSVITNVEQYSYARHWYAKPPNDATLALLTPAPPPPAPFVMYSQASVPPAAVASLPGASVPGLELLREVPKLSCVLHPWVHLPLRRSAVAQLGRLLLSAWNRGVHDPVLVYVLEASLTVRRLTFALQVFALSPCLVRTPPHILPSPHPFHWSRHTSPTSCLSRNEACHAHTSCPLVPSYPPRTSVAAYFSDCVGSTCLRSDCVGSTCLRSGRVGSACVRRGRVGSGTM